MHQLIDSIAVTPAKPGAGERPGWRWLGRWACRASVVAASLLGVAALAGAAGTSNPYRFRTLDNENDLTFNQLLAINQQGVIAGYLGSGAQRHPSKGYLLFPKYGRRSYVDQQFPGSVQTQVTGLNNRGVTVGSWSSMNSANAVNDIQVNDSHAFVEYHGRFRTADFPTGSPASPPVDQLLGVNDNDVAVGFYNAGACNTYDEEYCDTYAYEFNIRRNQYTELTISGISEPTAAAINDRGEIAGFGLDSTEDSSRGQVAGFLLGHGRHVTILHVPGSSMTSALGINDSDEVVGVYQAGSDSNATHGFTWTKQEGFKTVDDPLGKGTTTINGVNDKGQLVGFYVDRKGNTDGMLATPAR